MGTFLSVLTRERCVLPDLNPENKSKDEELAAIKGAKHFPAPPLTIKWRKSTVIGQAVAEILPHFLLGDLTGKLVHTLRLTHPIFSPGAVCSECACTKIGTTFEGRPVHFQTL